MDIDQTQPVERTSPAEKLIRGTEVQPLDFNNENVNPNLPREVAWLGEGAKLLGEPQDLKVFHADFYTKIDLDLADAVIQRLSMQGVSVDEIHRHFSLPYEVTHDKEAPRTYPSSPHGSNSHYANLPVEYAIVTNSLKSKDDKVTNSVVSQLLGNNDTFGSASSIVVGEKGFALVPTLTRGRDTTEHRDFIPLNKDEISAKQLEILMNKVYPDPKAVIIRTPWRADVLITGGRTIESPASIKRVTESVEAQIASLEKSREDLNKLYTSATSTSE